MTTCETCARDAVATATYDTGPMELCVRCAWRAVSASGGIVTAIVTGLQTAGYGHPLPITRPGCGTLVGVVEGDPDSATYSAIIGYRRPVLVGHGPQWIVGRAGNAAHPRTAVQAAMIDAKRAVRERAGELARVDRLDRAGEHDRARALLPTCAGCGHSEYEHGSGSLFRVSRATPVIRLVARMPHAVDQTSDDLCPALGAQLVHGKSSHMAQTPKCTYRLPLCVHVRAVVS